MYSEILSHIRTSDEVKILFDEIDILLDALYKEAGQGFESTLRTYVRDWVSGEMKKAWSGNVLDKEEYLKKLKSALENLKSIKLTLAFEPTDASLDKFYGYVRQNIGEGIILEINYEPTIIAGALIAYEGEYRDFSLKRLFEEELIKMNEQIVVLLEQGNSQLAKSQAPKS